MKRAINQGQVNQKRIAVWAFWDLILPVQRGGPGTKERRESNKEIEEAFKLWFACHTQEEITEKMNISQRGDDNAWLEGP